MPQQQPECPLTEAHCDEINKRLRELALLKEEIAKAESAGVPVGERAKLCDFYCQELEKRKRVYFPTRP